MLVKALGCVGEELARSLTHHSSSQGWASRCLVIMLRMWESLSFLYNWLVCALHVICIYTYDIVCIVDVYKLLFIFSLYRRIGPRSHVWSEKEFVDKAAWEFEEVCNLYTIIIIIVSVSYDNDSICMMILS